MSRLASAPRAVASASARASAIGLIAADWRRMRGTWILPLTVLGPLGVTLLGVILFLLRGEYMLKPFLAGEVSGWRVAIDQLGMVHIFALGLGAALIASMIVDVEHRSDIWKQLFGMPVSRAKTYVVKFAWAAVLLAVSSALMSVGYAAIMVWQDLGPLPWADLARAAWLPWVAALPLLALQLLLSTAIKNQAVPLAAGIVAPMFGMGMSRIPAWMPWRLMTEAMTSVAGGAAAGGPGEALTWYSQSQVVSASGLSILVLVTLGAAMLAHREIR
ncbi:MAG: hypothetical protein CVT59_03005 [Actinobacteria bacterium HGW-Actinobacteria-1]|jgi:hypothetical protein|nr:MAG: hypothetical protein CVT59_03005 [Actinobacteria bacterium HGW-Actinobacteria-1]